jgi:hypothetical protein
VAQATLERTREALGFLPRHRDCTNQS